MKSAPLGFPGRSAGVLQNTPARVPVTMLVFRQVPQARQLPGTAGGGVRDPDVLEEGEVLDPTRDTVGARNVEGLEAQDRGDQGDRR